MNCTKNAKTAIKGQKVKKIVFKFFLFVCLDVRTYRYKYKLYEYGLVVALFLKRNRYASDKQHDFIQQTVVKYLSRKPNRNYSGSLNIKLASFRELALNNPVAVTRFNQQF